MAAHPTGSALVAVALVCCLSISQVSSQACPANMGAGEPFDKVQLCAKAL